MKFTLLYTILLCVLFIDPVQAGWWEVCEEGETSDVYYIPTTAADRTFYWKGKSCCEGECHVKIMMSDSSDMSDPALAVGYYINWDCDGNDSRSDSYTLSRDYAYVTLYIGVDRCDAPDCPKGAIWYQATEPTLANCNCSEP